MEVCNTVQGAVTKTIPKKKKCKKANWFSGEALKIAEKRKEVKDKGERERYSEMNAKFQRLARRDKDTFLNEQCEETKENNQMAKTRNLLKKTGDIKRTFHARMGTIKDRSRRD